jgi:5'(3')-deoxyribonucleotidase
MPRIIVDMDGVLADTYVKFIDRYEAAFGRRPTRKELLGRKVYDLEGAADIRNAMYEEGFFRDISVVPEAVEVMRELYDNHEVYIVSTAAEFKHSYKDKWEWLEEHFPFIHFNRIVFCGNKSIVHGDYMIDDKVSNLAGFNGKGLLFDALDNHYDTEYHRVHNWEEVRDYFRDLPTSKTVATE